MTHYACQGECGGVSSKPGKCSAEGCSCQGQDLKECDCSNPEHTKKLQKKDSEGGREASFDGN